MPTIAFENQKIECEQGDNLRKVLLKHQAPPYNGMAVYLNCHGMATCGTCAVKIEGPVSDMATREKVRLSLAPHHVNSRLRLSCQCQVMGDIKVEKFAGFWGQKVGEKRPLPQPSKR